ncbi:MAG TPA: DNA polymerase III subunit epsilon [Gammaproteobacteria bacterium]|nr:DNA polymerase III subunit epsilon [Gammaproteobacteria bacterium]
MRQIVLDTETTGLDPEAGHRIIEIGCVEIANRRILERRYHQYINPQREIDPGAFEVHGLSSEMLSTKPKFAEIAEEFLEFVRGAELIIHNAPFDIAFLDHEFDRLGDAWGPLDDYCDFIDTLVMARDLHPGQRNSLDALCRRYAVDNTGREMHGALLDAELLADVYLSMTGGQVDLQLATESFEVKQDIHDYDGKTDMREGIPVIHPSAAELAAHNSNLQSVDAESEGNCLWLRQIN